MSEQYEVYSISQKRTLAWLLYGMLLSWYDRNVLSMKKLKKKSDNARGGQVSKTVGTANTSGDASPTRVCRDFLRNVCHRGKRCKYLHERSEDDPVEEYTFCHDFQNGMCNWPGCKFLHCTESEEKRFRATGELPAHILSRIKNNNEKSEYPMCKDFIKGSCQRTNCKFRHWKSEEPQHNLIATSHHNVSRPQHNFNGTSNGENRRYEEDRKETVVHFEASPLVGQHTAQPVTPGYYYPVIPRNEARAIVLEDENALLRKKIEELKKQVSDLTATNEFLLDQNAQLRMSGKRTANVTAVTVPAVTITNTVPPSQAPTPQQMVNAAVAAGTLRTVTASVATVPVSIATVAPVSIAAVSMAPATNQQPPNTQQPASLPLSISGATAPLVSYPIMTQELRPVLQ
ncbi:Zinc finger CCCH domain-containing protein 10 [Melipona quadrifasciata]|uniref:Zinc finger CCCH domain-containing protein 10 n=1 Tax=Melipona quadrifasciata TaxID=166423 RepID=A0A0M8ZTT4_9HYME|nr:Zinc finger CCCH domain-containing protein 10 [Melipona quadrifasciata]